MPAISKIRFTNLNYDNGNKRYIDTTYAFDGENGILLLENGGGKTVFVQALIQAVLPRKMVAQRKIQETLMLNNSAAHIAVEWILEDEPRRYGVTAVTLFLNSKDQLSSQEFAMEYDADSELTIAELPFVQHERGKSRPATREEMANFFRATAAESMRARFFSENDTLIAYDEYIEKHFKIVASEWNKIAAINSDEGGVEAYFENCRTTNELIDRLLVPTVEEGLAASRGQQDTGNGFVQLFADQREHFKQQRRLKVRIEEMQGVLAELAKFTAVKQLEEQARQKLMSFNSKLKSYQALVQETAAKRAEEAEQLAEQLQSLVEAGDCNAQAQLACRVAEAQARCQVAEAEFKAAQSREEETMAQITTLGTERDNLQMAAYRREWKQASQKTEQCQAALAELDKNPTIQEYRERLETNSRELHGYFVAAEDVLDQQRAVLQAQQGDNQSELAELAGRLRDSREQRGRLEHEIGRQEGQLTQLLQQLEHMEQTLFPDAMHQDIGQQADIWQQELEHQTKQERDYQANVEFFTQQKTVAVRDLAQGRKELDDHRAAAAANDSKLKAIESHGAILLKQFALWPAGAQAVGDVADIYRRREMLRAQLGDELVQLEAAGRKLDDERRRAHRWIDLYDGQAEFVADPRLLELVEEWNQDFTYLKTGAEIYQIYAEREGIDPIELYQRYPWWAVSVITLADEADALAARLQRVAGELFQPVFVLTDKELRTIGESESLASATWVAQPQRAVIPDYWQNVQPEQFATWLTDQRKRAAAADQALNENDQQRHQLRRLFDDLQDFVQHHPYDDYRTARETREEEQRQIEVLERRIHADEDSLKTCETELDKLRANLTQLHDRKRELQEQLRAVKRYVDLQTEQQSLYHQMEEMKQTLAAHDADLARLEKQRETLFQQKTKLAEDVAATEARRQSLHERLYWRDVQEATPQPTELSYETLADQRRELQNRLDGFAADRGRLDSDYQNAREKMERLQRDMQNLRDQTEYELDEAYPYPPDGAVRLAQLRQQEKPLKKLAREQGAATEAAKTKYDTAVGRVESELGRYHEQYKELITFTEPLDAVRHRLQQERHEIDERKRQTEEAASQNEQQCDELAQLLKNLEIKNERLGFAIDEVPAAILETWDDPKAEDLRQTIAPCLRAAEEEKKQLQEQQQACEKQAQDFVTYCEQQVGEERMRRNMVDGIRSKQHYQEYLDWQNNSRQRIQAAISLSESERQSHYQHMEQLVEHMSLYLQEIGHGLGELANRTRIRIGENVRNIYTIALPEWDDALARTSIRKYLEDLAIRLDSDNYCDESGHEDSAKVQEYLGKVLRTQQVLGCVYGNQAIKVRCRKAAGGHTFSERAHTWEESNKWSGAERWSKNMALFLGCLSYLSEKRCHVRRTKHNNRVVVADNPFGKASSDHVLEPVFYIAQQLGFQIIALTAHQEGNFIRKYFPVVYSCRFAELAKGQGKVLQPERVIETAFLEEKQPTRLVIRET